MANDPTEDTDLDAVDDGWDLDDDEEEAPPSTRAVDAAELLRLSSLSKASPEEPQPVAASDESTEAHARQTAPPPAHEEYASTIRASLQPEPPAAVKSPSKATTRRPAAKAPAAKASPFGGLGQGPAAKRPVVPSTPTPAATAAVTEALARESRRGDQDPGSRSDGDPGSRSDGDSGSRSDGEAGLSSLGAALDLDLGDLSSLSERAESGRAAARASAPPPAPAAKSEPAPASPASEVRAVTPRPAAKPVASPLSIPRPGRMPGLHIPPSPPRLGADAHDDLELGLAPEPAPEPELAPEPAPAASEPAPAASESAEVAGDAPDIVADEADLSDLDPELLAALGSDAGTDEFSELEVDEVLERVSQLPPPMSQPPEPVATAPAPESQEEDAPAIEVTGPSEPSVGRRPLSSHLSVRDFPLVTFEEAPAEPAPTEAAADLDAEDAMPAALTVRSKTASAVASDDFLTSIEARYSVGDYSGALVLAEGALEEHPGHPELVRYVESCQSMLRQMYLSRLGRGTDIPRVAMQADQLRWLTLDHRTGFLISCIDGQSSIEEVLDVAMMPPLEALRSMWELLQEGVIEIAPPDGDRGPA